MQIYRPDKQALVRALAAGQINLGKYCRRPRDDESKENASASIENSAVLVKQVENVNTTSSSVESTVVAVDLVRRLKTALCTSLGLRQALVNADPALITDLIDFDA